MNKLPSLWHGQKFTPLWLSQSLSALNDNLFRYAFNTALMFGVITIPEPQAKFWVSMSAAFFILPYLLFSALAGQIADRHPKHQLLRINRLIEIFVFALGCYGLVTANLNILVLSLFLTGTTSAFYSPVKYAITPELVPQKQLLGANGAIEAGVYIAILLGTILGTALIVLHQIGPAATIAAVIAIALAAWMFSLIIPSVPAAAPDLKMDYHILRQIWKLLRWGGENKMRTKLLLGHAWFWFVGAAILSQLTIFVKTDLNGAAELNTLFLALFAIGIGIGGFLCSRILKHEISLRFVPHAAIGMAVSAVGIALTGWLYPAPSIPDLASFLLSPAAWLMMLCLLTLSASAGLYVVPILSSLQLSVAPAERARLLSLANIWFAIFVIISSLLCTGLLTAGLGASCVIAIIGLLSLGAAAYMQTERNPL